MLRIVTVLLAALLLLPSQVFAGPEVHPQAPRNMRIINGVPLSARNSPVAKLIITAGLWRFLCSGVLIAPNVVLTARHCVPTRPSDLGVHVFGKFRSVSKIRVHPRAYEKDNGVIHHDMALVFLRRNVSGQPLSILQSRQVSVGERIDIYGYGLDESQRIGKLNVGTMIVAGRDGLFVYAEYDGSLSNTCEGDSGGPAVMTYTTPEGRTRRGVVAITAGGRNQDCSPDDVAYFTSLQTKSAMRFFKRNVPNLTFR